MPNFTPRLMPTAADKTTHGHFLPRLN